MKILLVTNMYPCDDAPSYGIFVKEQEKALSKVYPNIQFTIAFIDARYSKVEYIKSVFKINRLIKEQDFDLVHIHYGFSGLFLLWNKLSKKIPTLITLHGGDIQAEQGKQIQVFFTKLILKKASAAITLNERMDKIAKQYIKKTEIIPCSVNTDIFTPSNTIKYPDFSKEVKIIFPSDRNRYVKNYPLFEQVIKKLESTYNLRCKISEIKNMSRQQVAELYRNSDLMIMTSISEGSPQVVKEAMACNLPIISTNVGDVSLLLENVKNSAVSNKMEAEELAFLAYQALNNQIKGINGRDKIFQMQLNDQAIAQKIYNLYTSLLSNHQIR